MLTEVPNDKWWGDKPLLDKITFRAISPDATAAAFANNEIDSFDIGPDPDGYQRVKGVSDATIRQAAGPNFRHFTFNTKAGVLTDQKVRQAIVKGLDREAIGASDLAGIDWPVQPLNNNILLQNQEGYKDVAAETGIDYDVEGAKSDLDALGWTAGADGIREKDGKKLEVKFSQLSGVAVSENEALQAQNQLKESASRSTSSTCRSTSSGRPLLSNHEFDIIAFTWIGTPYPFQGVSQLYGTGSDSNYSQLSDTGGRRERQAAELRDRSAKRDRAGQRDGEDHLGERDDPAALPAAGADRGQDQLANYGAFGLSIVKWENVGYQK